MCHCTVNSDGQGGQCGARSQDSYQQALTRAQLCLNIPSPVERSEDKGSTPESLREHSPAGPAHTSLGMKELGLGKGRVPLLHHY